ncbi:MAG: HAD-IB family hydrolase [Alcanivorax sp.]|nr:HAD-IB family hydrolase [Alcanivorax sp.]
MTLALFDLDNTLIAGDSDHLWGDYLVARGIIDADGYKATNDRFYEDYLAGHLDIGAYLRFALGVLAEHPQDDLLRWRDDFMRDEVAPIMLPAARTLLDRHRQQGHTLVIITATNDFVTAPIAEALGVEHLIATTAEVRDGRYTGDFSGTPCFRDGKVTRLRAWLSETGHDLAGSWFYSDSRNDLPLLSLVDHPVVVDPDPALSAEAASRGWPEISLRG